jgi:hypothetical protein
MSIHPEITGAGDTIDQLVYLPGVPVSGNNTTIVGDERGTSRYFYALLSSKLFYRFDTHTGSWQQLPSCPSYASDGSSMMYDPTNDRVWVAGFSGNTTKWWGYYDVETGAWTEKSSVGIPLVIGASSSSTNSGSSTLTGTFSAYNALGDDSIYFVTGNSIDLVLYKYTIATDTWESITAPIPDWHNYSRGLHWLHGGDTDKLVLHRGASGHLFVYSISGNSWTITSGVLPSAASGSCTMYDPTSNSLRFAYLRTNKIFNYALATGEVVFVGQMHPLTQLSDQAKRLVLSVSPSGARYLYYGVFSLQIITRLRINAEVDMAIEPYGLGDVVPQIVRMADQPYALDNTSRSNIHISDPRGTDRYVYSYVSTTRALYRFDTYTNGWQALATNTMASADNASTGVFDVDNNAIWIFGSTSSGSTIFFSKYDIATNTWSAKSVAGLPAIVGGGISPIVHTATALGGNGDLIYVYGYGSTVMFSQYSISANAWAALSTTPGTAPNGCLMVWDYANDANSILFWRGNINTLWQYNITGNTWTQLTSPYSAFGNSSSCAYDPTKKRVLIVYNATNQMVYYDTVLDKYFPAHDWSSQLGAAAVVGSKLVYVKTAAGAEYLYFNPAMLRSWLRTRINLEDGVSIPAYGLGDYISQVEALAPGLSTAMVGNGTYFANDLRHTDRYIYASGNYSVIYRYDTITDAFQLFAYLGFSLGDTQSLLFDPDRNYRWCFGAGSGATPVGFRCLDLSTGIVTVKSVVGIPAPTYGFNSPLAGCFQSYNPLGDGDSLYLICRASGNIDTMFRYTISTDTWTSLGATGFVAGYTSQLVWLHGGDTDKLLMTYGSSVKLYSISANTYSVPILIQGNVFPGGSQGGGTAYDSETNSLHAIVEYLQQLGSKYDIANSIVYPANPLIPNFTMVTQCGNRMCIVKTASAKYIYYYTKKTNTLYRTRIGYGE